MNKTNLKLIWHTSIYIALRIYLVSRLFSANLILTFIYRTLHCVALSITAVKIYLLRIYLSTRFILRSINQHISHISNMQSNISQSLLNIAKGAGEICRLQSHEVLGLNKWTMKHNTCWYYTIVIQHSAFSPRPSTLGPRPSALGPRPSAPGHRSSIIGLQPSALGPWPLASINKASPSMTQQPTWIH